MNTQNYINHIALVLDASGSMQSHSEELVKVADNQIAYLAQRSKELDQETRVTVYTFNYSHNIKCLIYDKDVLRIPSIRGLYNADGQTALIDATLLALNDLALTPEKYGEHAFLIYVLTDGQENNSRQMPSTLSDRITGLNDNWTVGVFVPDQTGVFDAKAFGFPKENIAVWDSSTRQGLREAGETIRRTTDTFMLNRQQGIHGSRSLFAKAPSSSAVKNVLGRLYPHQYQLLDVDFEERIDEFVADKLGRYILGEAYYELVKSEIVQPQKNVAILTGDGVYTGTAARRLIGLPDYHTRLRPDRTSNNKIFIQSTSPNRKLVPGTQLLIIK